ncbi:MAG TPA: rhodanese-like domain-containing protein [Gemmatimonadaceae bacterium]|nr:rhodanese-like domain-containing protein [Gemmatimonadaceae bacterium]
MDVSFEERVRQAKARITEVMAADAIKRRKTDSSVVWVDVRELNEWNLFRIPGALHVPLGNVSQRAAGEIPRDKDVVIYCSSGNRSAVAADTLQELGYDRVSSLAGGIRGWVNAGGEVED